MIKKNKKRRLGRWRTFLTVWKVRMPKAPAERGQPPHISVPARWVSSLTSSIWRRRLSASSVTWPHGDGDLFTLRGLNWSEEHNSSRMGTEVAVTAAALCQCEKRQLSLFNHFPLSLSLFLFFFDDNVCVWSATAWTSPRATTNTLWVSLRWRKNVELKFEHNTLCLHANCKVKTENW